MKALPTISLPASCLARTPSTTPRECRFDDDKVPFRRCQNVVFTHSKLRFQVALPCNVLNSLSPCLPVFLSPCLPVSSNRRNLHILQKSCNFAA